MATPAERLNGEAPSRDPATRLLAVPGPSALLHPNASNALVLAARPNAVVAEILSDGTVQPVGADRSSAKPGRVSNGFLGGKGWTLWWQRRAWA